MNKATQKLIDEARDWAGYLEGEDRPDSDDLYNAQEFRKLADALEEQVEHNDYFRSLPSIAVYVRLERERDEARAVIEKVRAEHAHLVGVGVAGANDTMARILAEASA